MVFQPGVNNPHSARSNNNIEIELQRMEKACSHLLLCQIKSDISCVNKHVSCMNISKFVFLHKF